ncbi:ATP-binding protein [Streptomyces sp. G-G2]|uniref:ATP-binding protein n=1 Tax=Streptomyces sp. G-G2 TaxID=3046201 RepID=UPI0024B97DD0|nr:ATP-binding protein [Streptomyces sp. G-G2]MDJ0383396.1 ATP-binding protein [Streptomyces sp. G-G2]
MPGDLLAKAYAQRFSPTERGARLARHLALVQLDEWGVVHSSALSDDAGSVVGELAANAVRHGAAPGRDIELRLVIIPSLLRIEVTDARADLWPQVRPPRRGAESGYGMAMVAALAAAWGVAEQGVGKTVWAELRRDPPGAC